MSSEKERTTAHRPEDVGKAETVVLPYSAPDPAASGHQFLENLATGYWYSQVLFTALELGLFSELEKGNSELGSLAAIFGSKPDDLYRVLRTLAELKLIVRYGEYWMNLPAASRYLVRGGADYMGDFLLYRQFMLPSWQQLTARLRPAAADESGEGELSYRERNYRYVRAMDSLVRQKAAEIGRVCRRIGVAGRILDVGGGSGSLLRAVRDEISGGKAVFSAELYDLDEVIEAARRLYPCDEDWQGITCTSGDFRSHEFSHRYGCIILSNFLHAYSAEEAKPLFMKALDLLDDNGGLIIHDYFPDYSPGVAEKGALYDLCMMQNTYNGRCHEMAEIRAWLQEHPRGRTMQTSSYALGSDSALLLVGGTDQWHDFPPDWMRWARELGFDQVAVIDPAEVVTEPWVAQKCRFGCEGFGGNLQCPPHSPSWEETRKVLGCYSTALLVQGQPPGKDFHKQLLSLEERTFLAGFHKAHVYTAGPCTLCPQCNVDGGCSAEEGSGEGSAKGRCRQPRLARPAMEACGIDVYATVEKVGWKLNVVSEPSGFIKYIGLLLVQ